MYTGLQGILENLPGLKKDIESNRKILTSKAGTEEAAKARKAFGAGEADLARANRMLAKRSVKNLDRSKTEFVNGTAFWDVFFDFQNLADEAFKDFKEHRSKRKLNPDEYLALSMRSVANPFHMGKPEVLKALFLVQAGIERCSSFACAKTESRTNHEVQDHQADVSLYIAHESQWMSAFK